MGHSNLVSVSVSTRRLLMLVSLPFVTGLGRCGVTGGTFPPTHEAHTTHTHTHTHTIKTHLAEFDTTNTLAKQNDKKHERQ